MNVQILLVLLAVAITLILIVLRFSSGRYGALRPSGQATADYQAFMVNPDLRYYISGSDLTPNVVMGVEKGWTLDSDLWKRRDLEPKGLRALVMSMQAKAGQSLASLQGFDILDDNGSWIGNWYSPQGLTVMVRIIGERRVVISTPPVEANPAP